MKFNFLCPFLYPCLLYSIVSFLLLLLLRRFFFAYFGFILHPRKEEEEIVHCKLPLLCSSYFKKKWWWSWYKEVSGKSIKVCPDDNMSLNNAPNLAIYMKIEKKMLSTSWKDYKLWREGNKFCLLWAKTFLLISRFNRTRL